MSRVNPDPICFHPQAVRFAVEYDLHMDVLPGESPEGYPPYPDGCTANFYAGQKADRGRPKWHPLPAPSAKQCAGTQGERFGPFFVPMGCAAPPPSVLIYDSAPCKCWANCSHHITDQPWTLN